MAVTITNLKYHSSGDQAKRTATITGDSSYPNPAGYLLSASQFSLSSFSSIDVGEVSGYTIAAPDLSSDPSTTHLHYYVGASGTTGATSGGTPAGTNGTSAVTGTGTYTDGATSGALNLATPLFSGTGLTASGQVITTTSTHTMTLNQCAGMWLISATGATPPNLILSNTAVAGAAAVLTVQGAASTDAGAYKIVKNLTVGTVSALSGTAAAQTFTGSALSTHAHTVGASAGGEVTNGTDLSAVSFEITIYGY